MQVAAHPSSTRSLSKGAKAPSAPAPAFAVAEINAYIAIRDDLLAEAEKTGNRAKIESVLVANDFIAGCLQPARAPYQTQALPERAAIRERKRCEAIRNRVTELRHGNS